MAERSIRPNRFNKPLVVLLSDSVAALGGLT